MKKKNKLIISLASAVSIGSLVVGASLGCAIYHDDSQKTTLSQTKKDAATISKNNTNLVDVTNNSNSFNDNAYLETINQSGTVNPFPGSWTKKTALSYTIQNINDMVANFGVSSILRWVLIQNLNYNIAQYLQVINANIFNITVENFNYSILNANNNNNLSDFNCTIKFNIQFKATSKIDGNAITFSNDYTYDNVRLVPLVMSIGNAGYSYLQLVNNKNNTFIPNQVNYCQNAQISSNWTNKDFEYLLGLNWLPVPSSYQITTSNYQTALPAECTRNFEHDTSQSTIGQITFANFVSQYQLYTFNIGYKFNGLSNLVIECNNQYNANNKYEVSPNQQITLSINSILGTINPSIDHNVKIEWQQQVTSNNHTSWNNVSANITYSFNALNNGVYRAIAIFPNGKQTISNTLTINVQNDSLLIATKNNSYNYGDTCTLYISNNQWANLTGVTYQWMMYDSSTGDWVDASGVNNKTTYTFNVYQSATYELIINDGSSFSITSNSLSINVVNNTVVISASETSVDYAGNVTLNVDTQKWANNPDLIYTWTLITSTGQTSVSVVGKSTYEFNVTNDVICKLVITSKTNKNFEVPSNTISITVNNNSIVLGVAGLSANESNEYNLNYGENAQVTIDDSYWNAPTLTKIWTYQWEGYGQIKNGKYGWQIINNPNNTNTLNISSTSDSYSMYQLILINKNNNLKLYSANVVTINVVNQETSISASWSNQDSNGASTIEVEQGSTVVLTPSGYWSNEKFTNNSSYEYKWYDATTNKFIAFGSSYKINNASKSVAYYLVISSTIDSSFKVFSNVFNIEVNVANPIIQSDENGATIGYGQQITLKLLAGNNNFWLSSGASYQWCTYDGNGVVTKISEGSNNYYQAVNKSTYTPFIIQKSVEYCLQVTLDGKTYLSNVIYVGYTNDTDNVPTTIDGIQTAYQTIPYYPSTYSGAKHILSIENSSYWTNPSLSSSEKVVYQWYSYQINSITGEQENIVKLSSISTVPYETTFNQINNGVTYYELQVTVEAQVNTPNGMQTVQIGNQIKSTITITAATSPVTCEVTTNSEYGNLNEVATSVYQCYYGSWAQLELTTKNFPEIYNGCSYQWEVFTGNDWANATGSFASGIISINKQNFAQFPLWVTSYTQYRLNIYLTNPNKNSPNKYLFSINSNPITLKVVENTINIGASIATGNSVSASNNISNDTYQFAYGTKITLGIINNWSCVYPSHIQYIWQIYDNNTESWINYDYANNSFNTTNQVEQGNANISFYFFESGQYRLLVKYWDSSSNNSSTNLAYQEYSLGSNILNLQVDHGTVNIGVVNKKPYSTNSNEYQVSYNTPITLGIEDSASNALNYYVQHCDEYTFNWTWTTSGTKNSISYSPTNDNDQYAPTIVILGYTTVTLTITQKTNSAFKLASNNTLYITCDNSLINVQFVNNSASNTTAQINGQVDIADSLTFSLVPNTQTNYWYGQVGYKYYWCIVQPDGSWIVVNNGTTAANNKAASYSSYALPVDNSDVINYQLLLVKNPLDAFGQSNITINSKITSINNDAFALRSNLLTIKIANAKCNITCNGLSTFNEKTGQSNAINQSINYGSSINLSFDSNYWNNYSTKNNKFAKNSPSYQWQENNGSGWQDITTNATNSTYDTPALNNNVQYRLELTWYWSSENVKTTPAFIVYSYPVTINVENSILSIVATANGQSIKNQQSIPFGTKLNLSIAQKCSYWKNANTVSSYKWTSSVNNAESDTITFNPYALGQEGEVVTYTLTITLNDSSHTTLNATFSVTITNAACTIVPTSLCSNSFVYSTSDNTYTINYGSLCKISVIANDYWASHDNGCILSLSKNSSSFSNIEFLAQNGTYQLTISNQEWGNFKVTSNLITIVTENNSFNLTASGNLKLKSAGNYSANYGTSIKLQALNGGTNFYPGTILNSNDYSATLTYQWQFIYSYIKNNKITYGSANISSSVNSSATTKQLSIYLLSSSSYNLVETYTVTNSSGKVIDSIAVNAASYINLSPQNIGTCSISCTNYAINSQGVVSAPFLSSPNLQLGGWLNSDQTLVNNSQIQYVWQNFTDSISATNTQSSYQIPALTNQAQYGLTVNIPNITQAIYSGNGLTSTSAIKTFSAISNVVTFKVTSTTITISPQSSSNISSDNDGEYILDLGKSATLQLDSNSSNSYWETMNGVSWNWYDLNGELGSKNPLTNYNGNPITTNDEGQQLTYNGQSLSLPSSVNWTTRTYYVVLTYKKNGKTYTIQSNQLTLIVNNQLNLTTKINSVKKTINNNQNIQLLFGDQQQVSFDYSPTYGVSQKDWNPQIYVNGVNATQTSTNKDATIEIDGISYPTIPINVSNSTYSFSTYPTPTNQVLSYQIVITAPKSENSCYPLKSVKFNVVPYTPKLDVQILSGASDQQSIYQDDYPYGFPVLLQGNVSNSNTGSNASTSTRWNYQWYKLINGVPKVIPAITATSNWPVAAQFSNGDDTNSFTPSLESDTNSYGFYVMDGMTGVYELGITNNTKTFYSNPIVINMLSSSLSIPTIVNSNAIGQWASYSNDNATIGDTVNIEYATGLSQTQSTNISYYLKFFNNFGSTTSDSGSAILQSSVNGSAYKIANDNLIFANQVVNYRLEYINPLIQQINPFDSSSQIMKFSPQYSNIVSVKSESIKNNLLVDNDFNSGATVNLTKNLLNNMFYFIVNSDEQWWSNVLAGDNNNVEAYVEQKINGIWTKTNDNPADSFGTSVTMGFLSGFNGFSLSSLGTYTYRLAAFSTNTYNNQSVLTQIVTTNAVTVTPVQPSCSTQLLLYPSEYTAFEGKKTGEFGFTSAEGANWNYLNVTGTYQIPWTLEVGEGTVFNFNFVNGTMPYWEDWTIDNCLANFGCSLKVRNQDGSYVNFSDFSLPTFTAKKIGSSSQEEVNAKNFINTSGNNDNPITNNYYLLDSEDTNHYADTLEFFAVINTSASSSIVLSPVIISFPKIQSNASYWSIQPNKNLKTITSDTYNVHANAQFNWNCSFNFNSTWVSSALDTTGFYTFVVQYFDSQNNQWISYLDPWTKNASFLTFDEQWLYLTDYIDGNSPYYSNTVLLVPNYYCANATSLSISSQYLLDNLAYDNYNDWVKNYNSTSVYQSPYQTLNFPSLNTWSVNPFSLNIAKSGKYRIAIAFSLYNYVTPTASQIQNENLEVYSPTYTFNIDQTTNIQLKTLDNSSPSSINQNGLTFYNLNKKSMYTLSYASSAIDWNGDGEYNQSQMETFYNKSIGGTTSFKSDTVTKDQYAMLWAGPVVILQYNWIYYPLSGGNPITLESWTNSIKGYDPTATTNSAMFNGIYDDASSGQILGLASGSTTQYQPGTGLNPQNVLADASLTLSGSTLKPGIYELAMNILYTSFIGIMVNSYNPNETSNTPYNWNVFGTSPDDIYTTVTSNPIIILPFTNSSNSNN